MAVVLLMGTILLLVPMNMETMGAEGRLRNTANSLVAAVAGARDRAILDSYDVFLELGGRREGDTWKPGWRFRFTSVPPPEVGQTEDQAEATRRKAERARKREWLTTSWHDCDGGVQIVGVSERRDSWQKLNEGGKPYAIRFFADGTVETGVAVRLENPDMDTDREYRTVTVMINGLTSEASWTAGEDELPESLPARNFGN
jgi:hypothetical protein